MRTPWRSDERGEYRIEWKNPSYVAEPGRRGHDWTDLGLNSADKGVDREAVVRYWESQYPKCVFRAVPRVRPVVSV